MKAQTPMNLSWTGGEAAFVMVRIRFKVYHMNQIGRERERERD